MSWHTQNAIKRIFNTFKRLKHQIYDNDIEALKLLNTAFENASKKYTEDNLLYAKLLAIHLKYEIMHFKDIKFAIKNTNDALSKPLSYHIEFLQMALNDAELENYFKSIGIDYDTHKDQSHIINANQKEALEKVKKSWSYENVEKSFYNSANDILKTTENYV